MWPTGLYLKKVVCIFEKEVFEGSKVQEDDLEVLLCFFQYLSMYSIFTASVKCPASLCYVVEVVMVLCYFQGIKKHHSSAIHFLVNVFSCCRFMRMKHHQSMYLFLLIQTQLIQTFLFLEESVLTVSSSLILF